MIIGLKKLLGQKSGGDSHGGGGWQQGGGGGGGGWDRSVKGNPEIHTEVEQHYAQDLAYGARKLQ